MTPSALPSCVRCARMMPSGELVVVPPEHTDLPRILCINRQDCTEILLRRVVGGVLVESHGGSSHNSSACWFCIAIDRIGWGNPSDARVN